MPIPPASVRIDRRGNAVFPHFDEDGLCGFEIKNRDFTGFASGGEKGLWFSRTRPEDNHIVLAESAIDALSYAALFPDGNDKTRYASIGGKPNPKQPGLIKATVARLSPGAFITAAFDADDTGRELVELVRSLLSDHEDFTTENDSSEILTQGLIFRRTRRILHRTGNPMFTLCDALMSHRPPCLVTTRVKIPVRGWRGLPSGFLSPFKPHLT
jgi:hypothetical protein